MGTRPCAPETGSDSSFKNIQYFTVAQVDYAGNVTYDDGSIQGNLYSNRSGNDQGHFNIGPNGTVVVDVPLSAVGNPAVGDILTAPNGQTKVLVGATQVGGSLQPANQGGPQYDYKIGKTCNGVQVTAMPWEVLPAGLVLGLIDRISEARRRRPHAHALTSFSRRLPRFCTVGWVSRRDDRLSAWSPLVPMIEVSPCA